MSVALVRISHVGFLAAREIEIGMTKKPPKAKETRSFGPKSFLARTVFLPEFSQFLGHGANFWEGRA